MRVTLYDAAGNCITDGLEDPRRSNSAAQIAIRYASERRRTVVLEIAGRDLKIGPRASRHLVELRALRLAHKAAASAE